MSRSHNMDGFGIRVTEFLFSTYWAGQLPEKFYRLRPRFMGIGSR